LGRLDVRVLITAPGERRGMEITLGDRRNLISTIFNSVIAWPSLASTASGTGMPGPGIDDIRYQAASGCSAPPGTRPAGRPRSLSPATFEWNR
jgi:hypothetical protein